MKTGINSSSAEQSPPLIEKLIQNKKRLFSLNETASYLGIASKTIRNQLTRGQFPIRPKRIGRRVLFDVRELDAFIDRLSE